MANSPSSSQLSKMLTWILDSCRSTKACNHYKQQMEQLIFSHQTLLLSETKKGTATSCYRTRISTLYPIWEQFKALKYLGVAWLLPVNTSLARFQLLQLLSARFSLHTARPGQSSTDMLHQQDSKGERCCQGSIFHCPRSVNKTC